MFNVIGSKCSLIAAGLAALVVASSVQADVQSSAVIDITELTISGVNVNLTKTADVDAALPELGLSASDTGGASGSGATLNLSTVCVSPGSGCPQIGEDAFPVITGAPSATYATSDQIQSGSPSSGSARLSSGAYVGIDTAFTDASANANNNFQGTWVSQGESVGFTFNARAYFEAFVGGAELFPGFATGAYSVNITITNLSTQTVVFEWLPNGAPGSITGGEEISDPVTLNSTVSLNAPLSADTINTGGIHMEGMASSGFFSATTDPLAANDLYQLSVRTETNADALRALTAALGDRVWLDQNQDGNQNCSNTSSLDSSSKIPGDGTPPSSCSEPGVEDVQVDLFSATNGICATTGTPLDTQFTDQDGFYLFTGLNPGDYCVRFVPPTDCRFTVQGPTGIKDLTDSDPDPNTGVTEIIPLGAQETDRSWDAGIVCTAPDIDIEKATNGVDADDPNAGDAPQIAPGGTVTWTYKITNTGSEQVNVTSVTDDQGVTLSCPQQFPIVLDPGGMFTCTASATADNLNNTGFTTVPGLCGGVPNTPLYENMARVEGNGVISGQFVQDEDPSHYCNPQEPAIDIEKATNGVDADDPNAGDAPQVAPGGLVSWTYVVTNTGNEPLNDVAVVDDQGVAVSCPQTTLALGESMICTASGFAADLNNTGFTTVPGLCGSIPNTPMYENKGRATGNGANSGQFVEDEDPSHYCNPQEPSIDIEKATNGVDADDPNAGDAPQVAPGGTVNWTYVVTNTGNTILNNVMVNDDQIGPITCPKTTLLPGESMICTASGFAEDLNNTGLTTVPGLCGSIPNTPMYENKGKSTGQSTTGEFVEDEDPSHYCNPPEPSIDIEKATNGVDADDPNAGDAPQVAPGGTVNWTYVVTNTGNTILNNVMVNDDQIGPITCPKTTLLPGESMICTASGFAEDLNNTGLTTVPGLCGSIPNTPMYENKGKSTGQSTTGEFVEDEDPSHYCNPPEPAIKLEKLTNGFDADTRDESSTSTGVPTVPTINVGATVTWTYQVTNTGNTVLNPVTVSDNAGTPGDPNDDFCTPNAGPCAVVINCPLTALNPGQSMNCTAQNLSEDLTLFTPVFPGTCSSVPSNLYENGAVATGSPPFGADVTDDDPSHYCNPGVCNLEVNKTCLVIPPPGPDVGTGSCQKPIDVLTLEYAGGPSITGVTWYAGSVSPGNLIRSTTAPEIASLNVGQPVDFNGFEVNDSPNDVQMVTSFLGGSQVTSEFHLSCSDQAMNGPEDCGTVIGDGKNDDLPAGNIWTFRGTARLDGAGISCPLPPVGPVFPTQTACEFTPPQSAGSCSDIKDITALTMIWQGADGIDIQVEGGEIISGINNGDVVMFSTPNKDTIVNISGAVTGTSKFHVSCSDDQMNGPEDCGASQGNGKGDDAGLVNQWAFEGMTGEKGVIDCAVVQGRSGAEVSYGIEVINLNNEPVTVVINDPLLGISETKTIGFFGAANDTFQLVTDPALIVPDGTNVFTNVVSVSGQTASDASCGASATASVTRNPPPPPPVSCSDIKDITAVSVVWDGPDGVDVLTEGGEMFKDVQKGNQITFQEANTGNDVELYLSGAVNGTSKFHVSCSDPNMNGSDDCGTSQGNGKDDDGGLINDWLLDGMTGENGSFECGLPNTGVVDPETGGPGGGDVTAKSTIELHDDAIKWELTNNGSSDVYITEVEVTWPDGANEHDQLKEMKLDGAFVKDLYDDDSPTSIAEGDMIFEDEGNPDERVLKDGDTKKLEIKFTEKYKEEDGKTAAEFSIRVLFSNGDELFYN